MFLFTAVALAAEPVGLILHIEHDLLLVDGREPLEVTAIYDDGSIAPILSGLSWSSSQADVVDISRDGTAAGLQSGTSEIVASWRGLSTQPLLVEVVDEEPWRIHIEPTVLEVLPGDSAKLTLVVTLEDGRQASATRQALWQARYDEVASVKDGVVRGKVEGETSVTATYRGARAPSAAVSVRIPTAVGITVDPQVDTMVVGSRINLDARAVFATGHSLDVSKRAEWTSSFPNVIDVDGAGRLTALRGGTAVISGTWGELDISPITIQVIPGNVRRLRFVEGPQSVGSSDVLPLKVEGLVSGRWIDLTHAVEWISGDEKVLLAARGGLLTGVSRGRTSVTVRFGSLSEALEIVVSQ